MPAIIEVGRGALYRLADLFAAEAHTATQVLLITWRGRNKWMPEAGLQWALGANSDFILSFVPSFLFSASPEITCFIVVGIVRILNVQ